MDINTPLTKDNYSHHLVCHDDEGHPWAVHVIEHLSDEAQQAIAGMCGINDPESGCISCQATAFLEAKALIATG